MDVALDGRVGGDGDREVTLAKPQARILSPRLPSRVTSVQPSSIHLNVCFALLLGVTRVRCRRFERVASCRAKEK